MSYSKALSDKGGDAPPMITSRQRRPVSPTIVRYVASPRADSSVQSVRARTATRGGISKWAVHHVVAMPGPAAGRLPAVLLAARASLTRVSVMVPAMRGLSRLAEPGGPSWHQC